MENTINLTEQRLADAWAVLQAHGQHADKLPPDANRIAFADPEFLLRRELRGVRMQIEMLKPELGQSAAGVENTIVVFGGARFCSPEAAQAALEKAQASGDAQSLAKAQRLMRNAPYYTQAREFGKLVAQYSQNCPAQDKLFICTGGGPGVMEAANRGAHDVGAPSVGLSIALPHEEKPNPYVPPELSFKFHYFAMRKMHFMMRAKALVAFPGGFGTLDELFEVLCLVQTRKAKPVPIFLYGSAYWKKVINFEALADEGAISHEDLKLFSYVDDAQTAWDAIKRFYNLS
ncbi:TIGR00730 family Rossman fold protein [Variovorax sp. PCZ-1]|uniref:LOG family protein n=1 Tax=Variovorax sp. PCZ-1 TaxID=2835533 RepID=UPI001BCD83F1|nr:TIGR00730 family Rossman fold protein [Variovorax sp. PCZ-1]MBS7808075.1 TIGR00730 family Rossman fold protein [Variovorax sp. PCZ-1]